MCEEEEESLSILLVRRLVSWGGGRGGGARAIRWTSASGVCAGNGRDEGSCD